MVALCGLHEGIVCVRARVPAAVARSKGACAGGAHHMLGECERALAPPPPQASLLHGFPKGLGKRACALEGRQAHTRPNCNMCGPKIGSAARHTACAPPPRLSVAGAANAPQQSTGANHTRERGAAPRRGRKRVARLAQRNARARAAGRNASR